MTSLISTITDITAYEGLIPVKTVYVLTNPELNQVYYGCTDSMPGRYSHHMRALKDGYHANRALQKMYDAGYTYWSIHQLQVLPANEADLFEEELINSDSLCLNVARKANAKMAAPRIITVQDVIDVKNLKKQGYLGIQIAKMLGLRQPTVSNIVTGKYDNLIVAEEKSEI